MSRKTIGVALVLIVVGILIYHTFFHHEGVSIVYKTAKVDRGDISAFVTATGTLNPTATVVIGSSITGTVNNVYVDFNDSVTKNVPLADLDKEPFEAKRKQALADLRKAQVNANLTSTLAKSNEELYRKRLISKEEYDNSKIKYSSDTNALEQARAELDIANANLKATTLRSPIDGIVISRKVNVGQAVSAGSDAALFMIAEDLARMRLDAHVSEADIGKVKNDQQAFFAVDAYPDETFKGKVWQIRNEPTKEGNVVTYDVAILVDNRALKLRPGMTAEVKILVAYKKDAVRVPRGAIRFIPPPSAQVEEQPKKTDDSSIVWIPLENDHIKAVSIKPGISDDLYTEIISGNLKEGDRVIIEAIEEGKSDSNSPITLPQQKRF